VNDAGKKIEVSAGRHGSKDIASHHFATVRNTFLGKKLRRTIGHPGQIIERAVKVGVRFQDRCKHLALTTSNVEQALNASKIVSPGHRVR